MSNPNNDGGSENRELYELKMSDLLKALPQRNPPSCKIAQTDPRNRANLSVLKYTEMGRGTFRSRAVLPENIKQLSNCQFKRRDYLRESLPASVPVPPPITAECSSQEGTLQSSNPVISAHLVDESKVLPFDSSPSVAEQLKKQETPLCILGVQAWTRPSLCEQQRPLKPSPQNVPTTEWFFEDLADLQRKLFLGASKKFGVQWNAR